MVWVLAILFALLAVPLLMGKGAWLIAGYNTANKEEKSKYNEKKLCRTMGAMLAVMAILTGLLAIIDTEQFAIVYGVLLTIAIVIGIVYANIGCKLR